MKTEKTYWGRFIVDPEESGYHLTTWEREIDEHRRALEDGTPIVTAAWQNLDKSGRPVAGPAVLWKQGSPKDGLNVFLRRRFYRWYGLVEGAPFVVWTERFVYFPVQYDGAESFGAVPLVPATDFKPRHFGGKALRPDG